MLPLLCLAQENNVAVGYYAIQHSAWPCQKSLAVFDGVKVKRLSFLWNTFGMDNSCAKRFLSLPGPKEIEIHLINEVCMKWGRCGKYEVGGGLRANEFQSALLARKPKFLKSLRDYFIGAQSFLRRNLKSDTTCYISPGLESNLNKEAAQILMREARAAFPMCKMVWSPTGANSAILPDTILERHGVRAQLSAPCISNLDGEDMYEVDIPKYLGRYSQCFQAHLWTARFNLLSHGAFVDPRNRRNIPTLEDFGFMRQYLLGGSTPSVPDEPVVIPLGCREVVKGADGAGGFLWKPKSDTQPGAVVLFPGRETIQFSSVKLLYKKKVIKSLRFSGWGNPDQNGKRQHWRADVPGYQLPKPLVIKSSSQKCWALKNSHERLD